ncbi:MAG TPA: cupin domain-containing protein [Chitinophagaceae bacterium]|nr:cupin domain-containing protein [Chitinophagaceae bacterium]
MSTKAFISCSSAENTRAIPGAVFSFLVRGHQTGNSFSLVKISVQHGNEPPAHTHTREDEFYYILSGAMKFIVDGEELIARAGECAYLPVNKPHQFEVIGEKAEVLMLVTAAGLDQWFWDNSLPSPDGQPLPLMQGPPPAEAIEHFVTSLGDYGVIMQ